MAMFKKQLALVTAVCCVLGWSQTVLAQSLVNPPITPPTRDLVGRSASRQGEPSSADMSVFADVSAFLQPFGNGKYGASTSIFKVTFFGFPKCFKDTESKALAAPEQEAVHCVETPGVASLTIDSYVLDTAGESVAAIREYVASRKGSPLSVTLPFRYWTTRQPDLRQTYVAFQPYASARLIPLADDSDDLAGSASVGGSAEFHADFEAGEIKQNESGATETVYPGFIFLSASASGSFLFGEALRQKALADPVNDAPTVFCLDLRAGVQFKGPKPLSLTINVTYTPKRFVGSSAGGGLSFTKIFGN